ncbi:aspartic peptidase domain-containing protein [Xylaria intraflava]|nr:aspartic peptidase domain-containing protein [Xylaria intraflava]
MIYSLLLALLAIGIASGTHNGAHNIRLPIGRRSPGTVKARDDPGYGPNQLRANITQNNYLSPYTVELTIGSPPQLVYPAIDLFSNNLWLNPNCNAALSPEACCTNGKYDPDNSTTAGAENCSQPWEFDTLYGSASGCTVIDDVQFAGIDIGSVDIGVANTSWGQSAGRLGLGFGCGGTGDLSILDTLKTQGFIATRQFSIALGTSNPSTPAADDSADLGLGELLFSGLNTRKYAGELQKIDSHVGENGDFRYFVLLTSIGFSDPENCKLEDLFPPPTRAFFDYTIIISYLPQQYMNDIIGFFPDGTYDPTEGAYVVPCYHRTQDASVDFNFGNLVIRVPLRDFILEVDGVCYLGAVRSKRDDEAVLGQSFLRGAYVVFDLDEEAIYMAQYENCGDELVEWDSSVVQQEGLCASKLITLPPSCSPTSTLSTISPSSHPTSYSTPTTQSMTTARSISTTRSASTIQSTITTRSTTSAIYSSPTSFSTPSTSPSSSTTPASHSTRHSREHPSTRTSAHPTTSRSRSVRSSTSRYETSHTTSHSTTNSTTLSDTSPTTSPSTANFTTLFATSSTTSPYTTNSTIFPTTTPYTTNSTTIPPTTNLYTTNSTTLPTTSPSTTNSTTPLETSPATSTTQASTHSKRKPSRTGGTQTHAVREPAQTETETVTIGVETSTIFMPSPIMVPIPTCHCPMQGTIKPMTLTVTVTTAGPTHTVTVTTAGPIHTITVTTAGPTRTITDTTAGPTQTVTVSNSSTTVQTKAPHTTTAPSSKTAA